MCIRDRLGVDLLKRLGMKVDFETGDVYVGNGINSTTPGFQRDTSDADTDRHGRLIMTSDDDVNSVNAMNTNTWCVVTCENHSIPSMSEYFGDAWTLTHVKRERKPFQWYRYRPK